MPVVDAQPPAGLGRRLGGTLRNFYRARRAGESLLRRALRRPRTVAESPNLLPLLIKVLAGFAKVDGDLLEEEIDSSLGFLRYDYPEAVYSELRQLFRQALQEKPDLGAMARELRGKLSEDRKILLGIQLYDLVHRAGMNTDNMAAYYSFMEQLGTAAQAIDIVYQLNSDAPSPRGEFFEADSSPLEVITFGAGDDADVQVRELAGDNRIAAYRHGELLLVKNLCDHPVSVQGRALRPKEFSRVYPGQRVVVDEKVLTHQDLVYYFNAKKNLSLAHLFITVTNDNEIQLEKARTRDSALEVRFGLKVVVIALKDVAAELNGVRLRAGTRVEANLEEKIVFDNDTELSLSDLRRHARSYGGRFHLKHSKTTYLVSNNPTLLDEDDILLAPGGGDVLLRIFCDFDKLVGRLEVLKSDAPVLVGETPVRNVSDLHDGDMIQIDANQALRCNFSERLLEEERNVIRHLEVRDLVCRFKNGTVGVDGVSFSATRGEMICVMGASGCGKSSLLRALAGQFPPVRGEVLLNGLSLYEHFDALKQYVTYIPQFDAFDEHLTIGENLEFAAAIRSPYLSRRERRRRIDGKLAELGLNERRDSVVGATHKKTLSGGERKRLNIGLDMIGSADIYLFDEPTSGLSSKDSEHVMEIIRAMAHNKIVIVTIHQPSSKIFQMFNKAMLLDRGGRLVFFGSPPEMLSYFAEAEHQQHFGTPLGGCPACGTTRPEFVFDVLETPLRDLSGDVIYEENDRAQLVPVRRYSPDFWRDKYEAWRLMRDVRQPAAEPPAPEPPQVVSGETRRPWGIRLREEFLQFRTLLARAFISKLRSKGNLATTMIAAPALAALIGAVLRYSEEGTYDFASSFHIPTYLFLSLVVAMFLGLTNSVDDIIRDRPVLQRERNLNVRLGWYILAKVLTLSLFAFVQCVFFILIGNWILEVRGMFWIFLLAMVLTAVSGIAIGLLISSLVSESKTAVNIIPIVLIPQIILGGALIKYEEMNQNLDFVYSITRWFSEHPDAGQPRSDLQVPLICEFMPMRWSYEALVYAQAKYNPLTGRQDRIQRQINALAARKDLTEAEEMRLDDLKESLAILSGLAAKDLSGLEKRMRRLDQVIEGEPLPERLLDMSPGPVSAERLFVNQKVTDLVNKAEMEQSDYRESRFLNVFFGPEKRYFGIQSSVLVFNAWVLVISSLLMFQALYLILRHQLKTRNM